MTGKTFKAPHTAIGTWAGYIYQGCCALLYVLRLLGDGRAQYEGYSLRLDSYEDFSIHNEQDKITSLHQCKSVKDKSDYNEEFSKMVKKCEEYQANGKCAKGVKMYFHCSKTVDIDRKYDIEPYQFEEGKTACSPGRIMVLISNELKRCGCKGDEESKRDVLLSMIDCEVLDTQQESFDGNRNLSDIALERNIPFSVIIDVLDRVSLNLDEKQYLAFVRDRYSRLLYEFSEDEKLEGESLNKVESLAMAIMRMDDGQTKEVIQRLNPRKSFALDLNSLPDINSEDAINSLGKVVAQTQRLDDEDGIFWHKPRFLTPSTLHRGVSMEKQCTDIYRNSANLDMLMTYDGIVGDVEEHVDDIKAKAKDITDVPIENGNDDKEHKNIFNTKKIGILTIEDKNGGLYD